MLIKGKENIHKGFVAEEDIVQMQPYKSIEGRSYADFAQIVFNKIEGLEMDLQNGLELEKDVAALCFATEDKDEGMNAFVENR